MKGELFTYLLAQKHIEPAMRQPKLPMLWRTWSSCCNRRTRAFAVIAEICVGERERQKGIISGESSYAFAEKKSM